MMDGGPLRRLVCGNHDVHGATEAFVGVAQLGGVAWVELTFREAIRVSLGTNGRRTRITVATRSVEEARGCVRGAVLSYHHRIPRAVGCRLQETGVGGVVQNVVAPSTAQELAGVHVEEDYSQ